jgi:hypothetical protein
MDSVLLHNATTSDQTRLCKFQIVIWRIHPLTVFTEFYPSAGHSSFDTFFGSFYRFFVLLYVCGSPCNNTLSLAAIYIAFLFEWFQAFLVRKECPGALK